MTPAASNDDAELDDGTRIGRYVVLRDIDGQRHAIAVSAVVALGETDGDTLLHLPGARTLCVPHSLVTVLAWLEGR
jgi:hypothetical protein